MMEHPYSHRGSVLAHAARKYDRDVRLSQEKGNKTSENHREQLHLRLQSGNLRGFCMKSAFINRLNNQARVPPPNNAIMTTVINRTETSNDTEVKCDRQIK